jgi:hypothetical protein
MYSPEHVQKRCLSRRWSACGKWRRCDPTCLRLFHAPLVEQHGVCCLCDANLDDRDWEGQATLPNTSPPPRYRGGGARAANLRAARSRAALSVASFCCVASMLMLGCGDVLRCNFRCVVRSEERSLFFMLPFYFICCICLYVCCFDLSLYVPLCCELWVGPVLFSFCIC